MALPAAAIPIIGSLVGKIIDKVAKNKVDDKTREELKTAAMIAVSDEDQEDIRQFYDFVVRYEGAAADMPKFVQVLRSLVRPVLTFVFAGYMIYVVQVWLLGDTLPENADLSVKIIFAINLLTLGFWFGERAVERSGILDLFKK